MTETPLSITDIVNAEFDDLTEEATTALGELEALSDHLATVPNDVFALAIAGLVKATADKKAGAEVANLVKLVVPALLTLV